MKDYLDLYSYLNWDDKDEDNTYMSNRLPIPRKVFNGVIPLRYYYGTYKIMFMGKKYNLKLSFDIDFVIKNKSDLDYLKGLNDNKNCKKYHNRENRCKHTVLIKKRDILKHIRKPQPFGSKDFEISLETKNIKSKKSSYFRFSKEQLLDFAGIDSTPSVFKIYVEDKCIDVSFSINCKGYFVKPGDNKPSEDIRQYLDKNPRYINFTILRNEFRINPRHFLNRKEEYLTSKHCRSSKKTIPSSLSDFYM